MEKIQISNTHLGQVLCPEFYHLPKWSQFHLHRPYSLVNILYLLIYSSRLPSSFVFVFFLVSRLLVVLLIASWPPRHPAEWIVNLTLNVFKVGLNSGLELSLIKRTWTPFHLSNKGFSMRFFFLIIIIIIIFFLWRIFYAY